MGLEDVPANCQAKPTAGFMLSTFCRFNHMSGAESRQFSGFHADVGIDHLGQNFLTHPGYVDCNGSAGVGDLMALLSTQLAGLSATPRRSTIWRAWFVHSPCNTDSVPRLGAGERSKVIKKTPAFAVMPLMVTLLAA